MTNMPAMRKCELVRFLYTPNPATGDSLTIGVALFEIGGTGFAGVRFLKDWRRVQCLDPHADPDLLAALQRDLQARFDRSPEDRAQMREMLSESSNLIHVSNPQVRLVEAPEHALNAVANELLKAPPRLQPAELSSGRLVYSHRRFAYAQMKSAFEEAGVWDMMMKRIAVAPYTFADDPMTIDCGYKPDHVLRLFHAIALDSEARDSKALAFTYPNLSAGIEREHRAQPELTAVVDENFDPDASGARFAFNLLRRTNIVVATTADLPELAARARRELRV